MLLSMNLFATNALLRRIVLEDLVAFILSKNGSFATVTPEGQVA
jgi:hypothetical protein